MPCEGWIGEPRASAPSSQIGQILRFKDEHYRCPQCGFMTPKHTAKTSGYDSEHSLRHIHCPRCGRTVAWPSEGSRLKGVIEGTFLTVAGCASALLLYPLLNVYGLQAGLLTSSYGILKILIL